MDSRRKTARDSFDVGLGGIFKGLGGFIDVLSELAEKGGEFSRSGETGEGKEGLKAVYGFSVKVGGGGKPTVERFGNVKNDGEKTVVEEAREPMVDLFDEEDHVQVIAELPGVDADDIGYEIREDVLMLTAKSRARKYHKEVLLPCRVDVASAAKSYRNGVFELKLTKIKA